MLKTVVKRSGVEEPFQANKLNRWGEWAADTLGDLADWSTAVLDTVSRLPEKTTTRDLQLQLIRTCLEFDTWSYNRMAGRLYASLITKDLYGNERPTVKQLHEHMYNAGYMVKLKYSDSEYEQVEKIIDHDRDFEYAHYQLHTHLTKYALSDRVKGIQFESSQFMYMRMAMALAEDSPAERRMTDVAKFYEHLSKNRINAPTPNHVNLGTPLRGYASCCVFTSADSAPSIAIGNHIANTMTYMSAGIGAHMNVRSINDPIRGGVIRHQGKLPYYRALVGEVKANLQNGRGGACTTYFPIFDPESETLLRLKNPMSTEDKRIRGMDYSWGANKFFARKVAKNEDVFLFNSLTAPRLYELLYNGDEEGFALEYARLEADDTFDKTYSNARELLVTACNEWNETGRIYEHNLTEMNTHTPFLDTIFSSNLCQEIQLPTAPYQHMTHLYKDCDVSQATLTSDTGDTYTIGPRSSVSMFGLCVGDVIFIPETNQPFKIAKIEIYSPEVATCNLAGIVVSNVETEEQYAEVAYYALLMIDKCIHLAHYELPHVGFTSTQRLNAGVGILGLAHHMARNHKRYTTLEGKKFMHEVAERHYYHLLRASLRLGKELGNAPWINRTKWINGWLPLDSYNKNVDTIGDFKLRYDWELLRKEIVDNGGIRNSVLVAHMPTESSSNSSGTTNGVYPIRELTMIKTDNQRVNYWAAPEGDSLETWYESAWTIPTEDMTDIYAILQKWCDQGISADFYRVVVGNSTIEASELIQNYLYRVKMGLKGKYYMNQKTSDGMKKVDTTLTKPLVDSYHQSNKDDETCESCTL